ncbi:MAG: nucleotidyltransferase domain-containing protein [Candidatus Bathyarchaeia archaeon]
MRPLAARHIDALAYGSIARGDVSEGSDIDVFIPRPPAPALIEAVLERFEIPVTVREIVQATPSYAAKGYIYVGDRRSYSFPLVELRPVERDFYGFAGSVDASEVEGGVRVPGVDKRLMLIEPTEQGHVESPVEGREGVVARMLGVSVAVVLDRVRTLRRRSRVGRTGVFLKRRLAPGESFGEVFRELSRSRPAVRRRLRM